MSTFEPRIRGIHFPAERIVPATESVPFNRRLYAALKWPFRLIRAGISLAFVSLWSALGITASLAAVFWVFLVFLALANGNFSVEQAFNQALGAGFWALKGAGILGGIVMLLSLLRGR